MRSSYASNSPFKLQKMGGITTVAIKEAAEAALRFCYLIVEMALAPEFCSITK